MATSRPFRLVAKNGVLATTAAAERPEETRQKPSTACRPRQAGLDIAVSIIASPRRVRDKTVARV